MTRIDLSPLYRHSVGFDRLANLLDATLNVDQQNSGFPPYNIEVIAENQYAITLAVAGFQQDELDVQVERGVLTVTGSKAEQAKSESDKPRYLHQGIAYRNFERRFNLADHVEVRGASLENGLLTISLEKRIPEEAKPRKIAIGESSVSRLKSAQTVDAA